MAAYSSAIDVPGPYSAPYRSARPATPPVASTACCRPRCGRPPPAAARAAVRCHRSLLLRRRACRLLLLVEMGLHPHDEMEGRAVTPALSQGPLGDVGAFDREPVR